LNHVHDSEVPHPHATTGKDGRYQLRTGRDGEGAPIGQYVVTLTWPVGNGGADRFRGAFTDPDGSGLTAVIEHTTTELPPFELETAAVRKAVGR
jgi:hypothetical protein